MGQKNNRNKETTTRLSEIESLGESWNRVRAIVIYGVKKTITAVMKWEYIASIDLENSAQPVDARQALDDIIRDRPFDESYFAVSLYYHLSTEPASNVIHDDIIYNLNKGLFQPTRSYIDIINAYNQYERMMAQKGTKLF